MQRQSTNSGEGSHVPEDTEVEEEVEKSIEKHLRRSPGSAGRVCMRAPQPGEIRSRTLHTLVRYAVSSAPCERQPRAAASITRSQAHRAQQGPPCGVVNTAGAAVVEGAHRERDCTHDLPHARDSGCSGHSGHSGYSGYSGYIAHVTERTISLT